MQTSSLIRWSGLAAVLGGALWIAKVLYEMNDVTTYARDITDYMFFVVPLLLLVGPVSYTHLTLPTTPYV